jgi:hypothetical protein
MKLFLQHCADRVTGVLSGFDRLMLHGSLRLFASREELLPQHVTPTPWNLPNSQPKILSGQQNL